MRVAFTHHAIDRLNRRMNIRIRPTTEVDISESFVKIRTYIHHTHGNVVENWASRDRSNPCVMVIDRDSQVVMTVITSGPVVTDAYRNAFNQ